MSKKQKNKRRLKKKHIYLSFSARLFILISLFIILVFSSILCIAKSINTNKKVQVNYQSSQKLNYKVYLKKNNFYEADYLEEDMTYVTSLIDNIKINYSDKFNIDQTSNLNYNYKILAQLIITPKNNDKQILFEKDYILLDKSNKIGNINDYEFNEEIIIDYDNYNRVANDFKTTYGVDCESKLYINKVLLTTGNEMKYNIDFNNTSENSLVIPLSEKQIAINKTIKASEKKTDVKALKASIGNKVVFSVGIALLLMLVLDVFSLVKLLKLLKPKKDKYQHELKRILNEYDRMIVSVNRLPELSKHDVYKVASFDELVDARDNLKIPIAYVKISKEKSCFYVKSDNLIYVYYLKSADL